ncbi:MAG: hypothetical protein K8S87_01625, partial [Planctomycetes bacterium]|nr:hypothetical protein [Planctomycetota bacterium]
MSKNSKKLKSPHDNFIPIPVSELINRISSHCKILFRKNAEAEQIRDLFEIMVYYYHHRLYENQRRMKYVYHPFSPDNELFYDFEFDREFDIEEGNFKSEFISLLIQYLNKANYEKVPDEIIYPHLHSSEKEFVERKREWINGFSSYSFKKSRKELMFYSFYRGAVNDSHPTMISRFLRKLFYQTPIENLPFIHRHKKFQIYNTLLLLHLDKFGKYQLRLFKSVNSEQLINLVPSYLIKLKIGFWAWLMMFFMLISSLCMGFSRGTKIFSFLPSGVATVIFSAIVGYFLFKFVKGQSNKKTKREYKRVKKQAHQLLASNEKVITDLGFQSEEEELKEIILGYYALFLRQHEKLPTKFSNDIKGFIQNFLKNHCHIEKPVNFEITDSIRKLLEMGFFKKDSIERIHRIGYMNDGHLMKLKTHMGILTEGELDEIVNGVILQDETRFTDLIRSGLFRFPEISILIQVDLLKDTMLEIYRNEEIIDKQAVGFINSFPSNPAKFFDKENFSKIEKAVRIYKKANRRSTSAASTRTDTAVISSRLKKKQNTSVSFEYKTPKPANSPHVNDVLINFEAAIDCIIEDLGFSKEYKKEICHVFLLIEESNFESITLIDKTLLNALYECRLITEQGYEALSNYSNLIEKILFESLQLKMVSHDFLLKLNDIIIEKEILPHLQVREPLGAFAHIDSIWDKLFISYEEQIKHEYNKKHRITKRLDAETLREREHAELHSKKYETSVFNEIDDVMRITEQSYEFAKDAKRNQIETVLDDLHDKFDRMQQKRKQLQVENKKQEERKKRQFRNINKIAAFFAIIALLGFFLEWFSLERAVPLVNLEITEEIPAGYLSGFELLTTDITDKVLSKILLTDGREFPFRILIFLIPFVSIMFFLKTFGNRSEQDFGGRWAMTCGVILIVFLFIILNINNDYGLKFISSSVLQLGLILSSIGLVSVFFISFFYTSSLNRVFVVLIMIALMLDLVF